MQFLQSTNQSIMRYRIPSTVIRYSPILLLYIITFLISDCSRVECFTRPTPPSPISIQKGSSNLVSQRHHTSASLQKKQITLYATADENNDGETILASSPSNEQQTTTTKTATRKQPTLAELEDLEEARLAQQEEQATKFNNGPSNLYNDVYSVTPKSISRIDNSIGSGMNGEEGSNEDPLNISHQTEIRLAKARDELQNTRYNEMFAEEDEQNLKRQQKIQQLMDEDDKIWKEQRRKKMMGKYADVDSWEEVEEMLEKDRKREVQGTFLFIVLSVYCAVEVI